MADHVERRVRRQMRYYGLHPEICGAMLVKALCKTFPSLQPRVKHPKKGGGVDGRVRMRELSVLETLAPSRGNSPSPCPPQLGPGPTQRSLRDECDRDLPPSLPLPVLVHTRIAH